MKRIVDKSSKSFNILVAEDDTFQRLALMDILTFCEYNVTAVENGVVARDELLKEDADFDIILLDLLMPGMDGLELLRIIMSDEKLKNIPVVMMSTEGEHHMVSTCLSLGAKDYLVKPLRPTDLKSLQIHIIQNKTLKAPNKQLKEKWQYNILKTLGQGASGFVQLVQRTDNLELYALKTIQQCFMQEKERLQAQSEVNLLKVLTASTIIKYYDSFIENDCLCIVMEYAPQGSLYDKIQHYKEKGETMEEDFAFYFLAQLVLAVYFMHSKNILHRDIKTQNLFLTKENIVKLGDFGIAKELGTHIIFAKTLVGTPYFMSPEVCSGEQYGQKADIWAIGCTFYEMMTNQRPFQHDNINLLFEKIKFEHPPPLPKKYTAEAKNLIKDMLNKDPSLRPSAQDLVKHPIICQNVEKYHNEYAKDDWFLSVILEKKQPVIPQKQEETNNKNEDKEELKDSEKKKENQNDLIALSELEEIASKSYSMVPKYYVRQYYASHLMKVVIQNEFKEWFEKNFTNQSYKFEECLKLLKQAQIIHEAFSIKAHTYLQFQADKEDRARNQLKMIKKNQIIKIQYLETIINSVNQMFINNVTNGVLNIKKIIQDNIFNEFEQKVCYLQNIELTKLNPNQIKSLFINLFQIMQFHQYVGQQIELEQQQQGLETDESIKNKNNNLVYKIWSYIPYFNKPIVVKDRFYYQINEYQFTLDDIKHGILRNNKQFQSKPNAQQFQKADPRLQFVQQLDPRVLFLFRENNVQPLDLIHFTESNIEEQLEANNKKFISQNTCYDNIDKEIIIHPLFKIYQDDFQNSISNVIKFILKYVKNIGKEEEIIQQINENSIFVQYKNIFE